VKETAEGQVWALTRSELLPSRDRPFPGRGDGFGRELNVGPTVQAVQAFLDATLAQLQANGPDATPSLDSPPVDVDLQ
jgi:hypothetical protein